MSNNDMQDFLDEVYPRNEVGRERADDRDRMDLREVSEAERVPMGGLRQKLSVPEIPGYHLHWINDVGDRLERAHRGGYTFVEKKAGLRVGEGPEAGHNDLGNAVSQLVGTQENGQPLRAYLMKIRQDWYEQDQYNKLASVREKEAQIKRGHLPVDNVGDSSKRYVSDEGIKIS